MTHILSPLPDTLLHTLTCRFAPLDHDEIAAAVGLIESSCSGGINGRQTDEAAFKHDQHMAIKEAVEGRRAYGAWLGNELAGVLVMDCAEILVLAVAERFRNQAIGYALLKLSDDILEAAGSSYAELWCPMGATSTRAFFEHHGWHTLRTLARPGQRTKADGATLVRPGDMGTYLVRTLPLRAEGSINVRPMVPSDHARVAKLWHTTFHASHAGLIKPILLPRRSLRSFATRLTSHLAQTLIVCHGTMPVGLAILVGSEVNQFFVAPDYQGSGVSDRLMSVVLEQLRSYGYAEAHLHCVVGNARARSFYERWGWRVARNHALIPIDAPMVDGARLTVDCHRMEIRLASH